MQTLGCALGEFILRPETVQRRTARVGRAALGAAVPVRGQSAGQSPGRLRKAAMEGLWLRGFVILLGAALFLPTGTQAVSGAGQKDLAAEQDLAKEFVPGARAVEPPEEGEITDEVEPGPKVFSSGAAVGRGPRRGRGGPEEDRDHLHHPQDDAREADARGPPHVLSLRVRSGPEEDRDHLHHG